MLVAYVVLASTTYFSQLLYEYNGAEFVSGIERKRKSERHIRVFE